MDRMDDRQLQWNSLKEKFAHVTDRLGMPIDEPIMETVIALNVFGITTMMSCGGHLEEDRRLALPWVMIADKTPEFTSLIRNSWQMQEQAERAATELKQLRQDGAEKEAIQRGEERKNSLYEEAHALRHRARLLQCPVRQKLVHIVERFYEGRIVPLDRHFIITVSGDGTTRLRSQGSEDFYLDAPLDIQQAKLAEYREEMTAFAQFLKSQYFASEM